MSLRKQYALPFVVTLLGCALPLGAQPHPRLIVVLVVDQMRADYLDRFAAYETGGFRFLSEHGANFVNATYEHMPTETCLGHSVLLSGRNPAHTGIVANDWYDRKTGRMTYCVEDDDSVLTGANGTAVSPKNFLGDNFCDWLQSAYPGARVFSLSLKDRAAILMAGKHPQGVFWFSHDSGAFITSSYYDKELPEWVRQFNNGMFVDSFAGRDWKPVLGKASPAYHRNEVDGQFPHQMAKVRGRQLNDAVYGSPFGDELLEAFAEAAVRSNYLGENKHNAPDLLAIGFSSNDAVGHQYGPDSPEIADEQIRLDRTLGHFINMLTTRLGSSNILWVLSADHGVEPTPEAEETLRHNKAAQRRQFAQALQSTEEQLRAIFNVSKDIHWFAAQTDTMLYFDRAELARYGITVDAAVDALTSKVKDVPGISGFYSAKHPSSIDHDIDAIVRNSAFPERSGDVYYLTTQWTLFSSKNTGTSHADPWPYNTHVPLILAGWHILPQRISTRVRVADVAPTLAELTHVERPESEALDGRSRRELLRAWISKKNLQ